MFCSLKSTAGIHLSGHLKISALSSYWTIKPQLLFPITYASPDCPCPVDSDGAHLVLCSSLSASTLIHNQSLKKKDKVHSTKLPLLLNFHIPIVFPHLFQPCVKDALYFLQQVHTFKVLQRKIFVLSTITSNTACTTVAGKEWASCARPTFVSLG